MDIVKFRRRVIPLIAWLVLSAHYSGLSHAAVSLVKLDRGGVVIKGDHVAFALDGDGDLRRIERSGAGAGPNWSVVLPETSFWGCKVDRHDVNAKTSRLISLDAREDSLGVEVETVYEHARSKLRIGISYRMNHRESDRLRTRYFIDNGSEETRFLRFRIATIGNLPVGPDRWVAFPYRSGKLIRSDKLEHDAQPSPGHLWMQWMGYYDGRGNGLLTYPEDVSGYLKFASHSPRNGLTLTWVDRVDVLGGERYEIPFDYVVRPLATPEAFNDLCHAYAEWGRAQAWFKSAAEKLARRPVLKQMAEEGIVKVVSFGALSMQKNKWVPVPRDVFIPRDEKEKKAGGAQKFDQILTTARSLEALYDVRPVYRYDGWWGRFDAEYPFVLPIHPKLGGDEKFKWFLNENRRDGRVMVLHNNPIQYDVEETRYDPTKMIHDHVGNVAKPSHWSGNRLVMASPRLAIADNLEVLMSIRNWGATGVFWDVIGATAPRRDFNPLAHYPYIGRDAYFQDLLRLSGALRDTAPDMIFGTEYGQEQMLPYFDYAPVYSEVGNEVGETWAPLNELVYGDAFFNAVGIGANNRPYNDRRRMVRRLFGSALGGDGRGRWTRTYTPVIQCIFEVNRVVGAWSTQRMLKHRFSPEGWRASYWADSVIIGNDQPDRTIDVSTPDTPIGSISVEGMRPYGFVVVARNGDFVAWGVKSLTVNGELLVANSNIDSVIINNSQGLTMASYGFFDRKKEPDKMPDMSVWRLRSDRLAARFSQLVSWPGRTKVAIQKQSDGSFKVAAPGTKQTYKLRGDR